MGRGQILRGVQMNSFPQHQVVSIDGLIPYALNSRPHSGARFAALPANRAILTPQKARELTCPIIYGLCNGERGIFYVGKTTRPKRRIYNYLNPSQCHSKALAEYLKENPNFHVVVLEKNPEDINESEMFYIQQYKGLTFNIDLVDYTIWREHKSEPWMAGVGVRCPSDYLMWQAAKAGGVPIKKAFSQHIEMREKMSKKERICFEVGLYKDSHPQAQKVMQQWFDRCKHDLLEGLM